ncbi:hypothetical protein V8C35DRAFT_34750 [Trichoderma chlorosporum]
MDPAVKNPHCPSRARCVGSLWHHDGLVASRTASTEAYHAPARVVFSVYPSRSAHLAKCVQTAAVQLGCASGDGNLSHHITTHPAPYARPLQLRTCRCSSCSVPNHRAKLQFTLTHGQLCLDVSSCKVIRTRIQISAHTECMYTCTQCCSEYDYGRALTIVPSASKAWPLAHPLVCWSNNALPNKREGMELKISHSQRTEITCCSLSLSPRV